MFSLIGTWFASLVFPPSLSVCDSVFPWLIKAVCRILDTTICLWPVNSDTVVIIQFGRSFPSRVPLTKGPSVKNVNCSHTSFPYWSECCRIMYLSSPKPDTLGPSPVASSAVGSGSSVCWDRQTFCTLAEKVNLIWSCLEHPWIFLSDLLSGNRMMTWPWGNSHRQRCECLCSADFREIILGFPSEPSSIIRLLKGTREAD